jgi:UDP-GlcNAc:undecaprenyl-phosphate GlcNAc-1-phosphate transferase
MWSEKSATLLGITAPFMALAVPLLDTGVAIVRRFLRHQPIFAADRNHIHHRLLDRGLSPRRVALILYAVCGIAAALSLLQSVLHNQYGGLIIIVFCGSSWIGIQHLGYAEFETARDLIFQSAFRRILNAQVALRTFETELSAAGTNEECWLLIRDTARNAGFVHVEMQLHGRIYEDMITEIDPARCWSIRVPINGRDYVNFSHEFTHSVNTSVFGPPLADVLKRILAARQPDVEQHETVHAAAKAAAASR